MQKFITLPLSEALSPAALKVYREFLAAVPIANQVFAAGGWIAGGFARHVLLDKAPIRSYFNETSNYRAGDVDFFFPGVEAANKVISMNSCYISHGGFAKETKCLTHLSNVTISIQFVDHETLVQPSLEKTLDRFDFVNCQVGLTEHEVTFPVGWYELEESNLLKIHHSESPFLGSRIIKYLMTRNLCGITADSYENLNIWFCRSACGHFPGVYTKQHLSSIESSVKNLCENSLMLSEDIVLFINKWSSILSSNDYGQTASVTVDWAHHELLKLKQREEKISINT